MMLLGGLEFSSNLWDNVLTSHYYVFLKEVL